MNYNILHCVHCNLLCRFSYVIAFFTCDLIVWYRLNLCYLTASCKECQGNESVKEVFSYKDISETKIPFCQGTY